MCTKMDSLKLLPVFLLCALITHGNAQETKVIQCPCTFSVSRQVAPDLDDENFDVFVKSARVAKSIRSLSSRIEGSMIEKHSARNLRVIDAIRVESGHHIFPEMSINDNGAFRVSIYHHSKEQNKTAPVYALRLATIDAPGGTCPVILRPDRPRRPRPTPSRISEAVRAAGENTRDDLNISESLRIVGGLRSSRRLARYMVAIMTVVPCPDGTSGCSNFCTGTLLSGRWVMTAAHCNINTDSFVLIGATNAAILIGQNSPNLPLNELVMIPGATRNAFATKVSRVIPHPNYDKSKETRNFFDIAVVELTEDISRCCTRTPRFMPVNLNPQFPRVNAFARAVGYGNIESAKRSSHRLLRQIDVPVVNTETCRKFRTGRISRARQICAGYLPTTTPSFLPRLPAKNCGTCSADSGGPLLQYSGREPVLIGVVSFGALLDEPGAALCAATGKPDVYTNPAGHADWLRSTPAVFTEHLGRISQVRVSCGRNEYLPYVEGSTSTCTPCEGSDFAKEGLALSCESCPYLNLEPGCPCKFSEREDCVIAV